MQHSNPVEVFRAHMGNTRRTFPELKMFLSSSDTVGFASHCLSHLNEANDKARVFLDMFLIREFPMRVFESMGTRETELLNAANDLYDSLMDSQLPNFSALLATFYQKFNAWKSLDRTLLKERITHALNALHQARSEVSPNDEALLNEFDVQIERLHDKLQELARIAARRAAEENHVEQLLKLPST